MTNEILNNVKPKWSSMWKDIFKKYNLKEKLENLYCENIYKLEGPFSVNINSNKLLNNNLFPEVNIPNYKPMPNFPHPDIFPDSPK